MKFRVNPGELPISQIAKKSAEEIRGKFDEKKKRTLNTIDIVSLFQYHFPKITPAENHPLDVILVDFRSNIQHLYTAGANIYSGVPYQSNMLMRTVIETIVKDMRLLALFESNDSDYQNMYDWITTKDEVEYDPELRTWGFAASRTYLFEDDVWANVRDLYAKLSKLVHGSSRSASYNLLPNDEVIESTWDNLYWLALNVLIVIIYAFRKYLPLNSQYQNHIKSIMDAFGIPPDIFETQKLPNLNFTWMYNKLQ